MADRSDSGRAVGRRRRGAASSIAWFAALLWLALTAVLSGCGGGGGAGLEPPVITTQPASVSVPAGANATFSVAASGNGLAYAWQRSTNGGLGYTPIAGASTATLTIDPVDASMDGHRFVVVVQNGAGIVVSDPAVLTVTPVASAPTFVSQPADQTVAVPAPATFTVAVGGTPVPTLTWESSSDGGTTWSVIPGASGTSYTTPATIAGDDGKRFRAVATNGSGSVTSQPATLRIGTTARGRFVYASVDDTIVGFALDPLTGVLTPTPGSPYASGIRTALALHPSGEWLLATAGGSAGTWVHRIDAATGRLTTVAGSPFTNGFTPGSKPVLDPAGRYLAMVSGTGMTVWRFDATTGQLTSTGTLIGVAGSAYVTFSRDSRFLIARDNTGALRPFRTDPLTAGPAPNPAITAIGEVFQRGDRLVALLSNGTVVTLTVDPVDGALSIFGTRPTGATSSALQLSATSDPNCLLLRAREAASSETMLPITIDPVTNSLGTNAPVTVPGVGVARWLAMHPKAPFGWLTGLPDIIAGQLTPLELGSGCTLAEGSGGRYAATPDSQIVQFDGSGTFMIGINAVTVGLNVSRIDPTTRQPVPVSGSPFATAAPPNSVVLRE